MPRSIYIPKPLYVKSQEKRESGQHLLGQVRSLEQMVRELSRDLSATQKLTGTGSYYWDLASNKISWTERAATIYGYPAGTPMNLLDWDEVIHAEDRRKVQLAWDSVVKGQTEFDIVYRIRKPDNTSAAIHGLGQGVYNDESNLVGVFGTLRDISAVAEQFRDYSGIVKEVSHNIIQNIKSSHLDKNELEKCLSEAFQKIIINPSDFGRSNVHKFLQLNNHNKPHILIVDDEPVLRDLLMEEFGQIGYETTVANGGDEAFELIKRNDFFAVLSDVCMPNGNGIDLFKRIKADGTISAKLFLMTGTNIHSDVALKELGCAAVFPKPFNIYEILKRVNDHRAA